MDRMITEVVVTFNKTTSAAVMPTGHNALSKSQVNTVNVKWHQLS